MTLNVLGPKRQQLELGLARDPQDPYVWRRSHRFPSPGRWIVCGANWQGSLEGCVDANLTRRIVRVRPRTTAVDVWHRLQRPLRTPSAATGTSCTLATPQGDLSALGFVGTAWGPGPAYPSLEADAPRHRYLDPIPQTSVFYGSKWFGGKTLWVFDRVRYRGPVLIRGRRVDGPEQLRFDRGRVPPRELRIAAHEESRPSFTRVQASGCYAFQVDGLGFSYTIVFSAIPG